MKFGRQAILALGGVSTAVAQWSGVGWDETTANSSICTWRLPRAHIVRDTVFLDGGSIWWSQGLRTGELRQTREDTGVAVMVALNLTRKFSLSDNLTAVFDPIEKAGASNNVAPVYVGGAMLGNDAQFFLYGGLTKPSDAFPDPDPDDVLEYQQFDYGGEKAFKPGFVYEKLPKGVTRYVAYGAAVSSPSEQKAWYFSGLKSNTSGVIYDTFSETEGIPSNISNTFISVEFNPSSQNLETWKNTTLPDTVSGRASAEGVFVPVGEKGILVFVGGVTHPEFASKTHESENPAALKADSEDFMNAIDIYDIAADSWYKQGTFASSGTPSGRAQGCAVVQAAKDLSSFNIYYYGGYSAASPTDDFFDDVWVLSLPSFRWIKARAGTIDNARAGHRCVSPYPDQMMVFGGWTPLLGNAIDCTPRPIEILNLTSVEWMTEYDPEKFYDYGVPAVVQSEIGGSYAGGATEKEPAVSGGWQDEELAKVFDTPYPSKIETWYPYEPNSPTGRPDIPPETKDGKNGLPKWVAPVLGVVLGLVVITAAFVAFLLWRRRKYLQRNPSSDGERSRNITQWLWGQSPDAKAVTETTVEEVRHSPLYSPVGLGNATSPVVESPTDARIAGPELGDTQIHELPVPVQHLELHDEPLSPAEIVERHSRVGSPMRKPVAASSSLYSSQRSGQPESSVSQSSAGAGASSPLTLYDGDSDILPDLQRGHARVLSGVSDLSAKGTVGQRESAGALRPISEATVQSPISPPTATEKAGEDYVTAISPIRKSFFKENTEDMSERRS